MPTAPKLPARIVNMLRGGSTRSQIAAALGITEQDVYDRLHNPATPDPAPVTSAALEEVQDRVEAIEAAPSPLHFAGEYNPLRPYTPGAVVTRGTRTWVLRGESVVNEEVKPGEPTGMWNFDSANYPDPYPISGGTSRLRLDPGGNSVYTNGVFPEDEQADPVVPVTGFIVTFEVVEPASLGLEVTVLEGDPAMAKGVLIGPQGAWNAVSHDDFSGQINPDVYGTSYGIQGVAGRYWYGLYLSPALAGFHTPVELAFSLMLGADPYSDQPVKDSAWQPLVLPPV